MYLISDIYREHYIYSSERHHLVDNIKIRWKVFWLEMFGRLVVRTFVARLLITQKAPHAKLIFITLGSSANVYRWFEPWKKNIHAIRISNIYNNFHRMLTWVKSTNRPASFAFCSNFPNCSQYILARRTAAVARECGSVHAHLVNERG